MERIKRIALVAHDNRKADLIGWVEWNWEILIRHKLICTGTTGRLVEEALTQKKECNDNRRTMHILKLKSGPLGGDQQLGAMISDGDIDILIFFWDPMQPQPHDVDVKALLRIAVLYNVVIANTRATADFIISSPLFDSHYTPIIKDYATYINRDIK
ncbi:MAG: methylglyoxal synthase [Bacteroidales bacterium]|jgi:methylglyoxal synthase|nr:methylglyoxal synthase [Bacteroidales bacterium]